MTQTILQKIRDWTIRRKILSGFAAVLLLTGVQGWFAIRQLERLSGAGIAPELFGNTRSVILLTTAVTVAVGLALAIFLARLIAHPLESLGVLAEEVSKGNLAADIRVSRATRSAGWSTRCARW